MPNPARTAVLPLPKGSKEKPIRGKKSLSVGLSKNGLPRWTCASVMLRSVERWPCTSVGVQ